jgi:hypothetical protein
MEPIALEKLQDLYFTLDRNFNRLFAACSTDAEKDQLRTDYVNARDAFWEARTRIFNESDPIIKRTSSELTDTKNKIDADLSSLQLTADTLKLVTAAVKLASSLIAFA